MNSCCAAFGPDTSSATACTWGQRPPRAASVLPSKSMRCCFSMGAPPPGVATMPGTLSPAPSGSQPGQYSEPSCDCSWSSWVPAGSPYACVSRPSTKAATAEATLERSAYSWESSGSSASRLPTTACSRCSGSAGPEEPPVACSTAIASCTSARALLTASETAAATSCSELLLQPSTLAAAVAEGCDGRGAVAAAATSCTLDTLQPASSREVRAEGSSSAAMGGALGSDRASDASC
mmetsp:Transcript_1552/g.3510  ORF Transcript_1552/g.3510 Transcript_1552/m.3510 type:complete len:236 (+) Transcript_1552:1465-2172(+)